MKRNFLIAIAILLIGSFGCSDDSSIPSAVKYEFGDLQTLPGYGWFNEEFDNYEVKIEKLQQITDNFNPSLHKVVIFSRPSCSCPNLPYKRFPAIYKILQAAGVPNSNIELYSLSAINASHPYDSLLTVTTLPAFYIFKSNVPVYSIADTLDFNSYYGAKYPIDFEDLIYEGLKK